MSTLLKVGAVLAVGLFVLAGCTILPVQGITGSGNVVTEEYDFDGFTGVDVSSAFEVTIEQGDTFAVSVSADDNLINRLTVEVRGKTLMLGLEEPTLMLGRVTQRAHITMPVLQSVKFSGATTGRVTGFASDGAVFGEVSGASSMKGDIEAGELVLDASGASNITLSGGAASVRAHASGASEIDLSDLPATTVRAEASGASTVRVNVSGELDAEASGASTIWYTGDPQRVREDTSGASDVKEAN